MKKLIAIAALTLLSTGAIAADKQESRVPFNKCVDLANQLIDIGGNVILNNSEVYMTKVWANDGEVSVQCFKNNKMIIRRY